MAQEWTAAGVEERGQIMARLKVRQKGEDRDRRGNHVSGPIKHDGRADISTKEHRRRPRDPSIKRSKIRDLTVRSSELLFFSIVSCRLASSS